jgi:hypothetical protein
MVLEADAASHEAELQQQLLEGHRLRRHSLAPHIQRVIERRPLVTASLLMGHGFGEGKLLGDLLKTAERLAIYHNLHTPEAVLQHLLK